MWGRTKDLTVIGLGASELDDYLRDAAAEQGRMLAARRRAGEGLLLPLRSLQLRQGRRARRSTPDDGIDYIGKPAGYGKQKKDEYTANDYHSPSDEVKPDWDLSGAAEDGKLLMRSAIAWPRRTSSRSGSPATSSRPARDQMLKR